MALLGWQQRKDAQQLGDIAQGYARDRVALELQQRANATARHAAESAASAIRAGDTEALGRRMQAFTDEPTLSSLTVRNPSGDVLYQWRRGTPAPDALQLQAIEPIRAMVESLPGAATPKTLGELRVFVTQALPNTNGAGLIERMTAVSRDHFQTALLLAGTLALLGGLAAAAIAWRAGRKL